MICGRREGQVSRALFQPNTTVSEILEGDKNTIVRLSGTTSHLVTSNIEI